jgi:hypothetical protein
MFMKTALVELIGLAIYGIFALHVALIALVFSQPTMEAVAYVQEQTQTQGDTPTVGKQLVIYEDTRLLMCCVIGSFFGAVLNVVVAPGASDLDTREAVRRMASKILASLIAGIIFSPMIIRYMHVELNLDSLLFVAGSTSFLAVGVLDGLVPLVLQKLNDFFKSKMDKNVP